MIEVSYETPVALTLEEAWAKLRDFRAAVHYVPGLTELEVTTSHAEGVGASRHITVRGRGMDETVTEWRDGSGFTIRLHRGDKSALPLTSGAWFDYNLKQRDSGIVLSNHIRCEMSFGAVGRWLGHTLFKNAMAKGVEETTLAQKQYYETGSV